VYKNVNNNLLTLMSLPTCMSFCILCNTKGIQKRKNSFHIIEVNGDWSGQAPKWQWNGYKSMQKGVYMTYAPFSNFSKAFLKIFVSNRLKFQSFCTVKTIPLLCQIICLHYIIYEKWLQFQSVSHIRLAYSF